MIDANSFLLGFIIGGALLFALGVGCGWRYWRERARRAGRDTKLK